MGAFDIALPQAGEGSARNRSSRLRQWTLSILHVAAMTGLVVGIVHIVSILLLPSQAPSDAWARVSAVAPLNETLIVSQAWAPEAASSLAGTIRPDPISSVALCRFDLAQAPVLLSAEGTVPLWTLSVFDTEGTNRFSLNDRTAVDGEVELVVRNPIQLARMRETPVAGLEDAIIVDVPTDEGFILLRTYAPTRAEAAETVDLLRRTVCEPLQITAS